MFARRPPALRGNRRGLGASASWRPTMLSGCVLWLRADLGITKDGSNKVSAWADQSGSAHHAVQATGSMQPLWLANAANGQPAVQGDGVDDRLVANWSQAQPTTTFLVQSGSIPGTNETPIDGGGGAVNSLRLYSAGGGVWSFYEGGGASADQLWAAGLQIHRLQALGAGAGNVRHSINGSAGASANSAGTANNGVCLFSAGDNRFYCDNVIPEVIQYNRALTAAEHSRVERYLGARYGIAVS